LEHFCFVSLLLTANSAVILFTEDRSIDAEQGKHKSRRKSVKNEEISISSYHTQREEMSK